MYCFICNTELQKAEFDSQGLSLPCPVCQEIINDTCTEFKEKVKPGEYTKEENGWYLDEEDIPYLDHSEIEEEEEDLEN